VRPSREHAGDPVERLPSSAASTPAVMSWGTVKVSAATVPRLWFKPSGLSPKGACQTWPAKPVVSIFGAEYAVVTEMLNNLTSRLTKLTGRSGQPAAALAGRTGSLILPLFALLLQQ
jgi:hypothetical protein